MAAPNGFTVLTANRIQNGRGLLLAAGTLEATPADASNLPMPATAGGVGGFITEDPAVFEITNGVLEANAWLPNSDLTRPLNLCWQLVVKDTTGKSIYKIKSVQPRGPSLNLDTYAPNVAPQAVVQIGPPGPAGAAGAPGPTGPAGPSGTTTQTSSTGGFFVRGPLVLGDIVSIATATMQSCLAANHNIVNGLDLFFAGPPYSGIYPSDFGIAADNYPAGVTVTQLLTAVDQTIALKDSQGRFPSAIGIQGTLLNASFFTPWDTPHNFPTADAFFYLPLLEYLAWQKSADTTHFIANSAAYETCLATLPRDASTGLVYINPAAPWVPWGFQEIVGITGLVLGASVKFWRVASMLATMYTAAGRNADAARWTGIASTIQANLQVSSPLWDSVNGVYRAATVDCHSNIDHYGSAEAVALGIPSALQQTAISNYFVTNASDILLNGVCRQTKNTNGGFDWDRYGQLGSDNVRHAQIFYSGQYQNGAWSAANGPICKTIAVTRPDLALQYATDQIASGNPMQEWFDEGGTPGSWLGNPDGGTTNLCSPAGSGGYILSRGAAPVAPTLGLGTSAPGVVNGRDATDGGANVKIMGRPGHGARLTLESDVASELRLTCTNVGDVLFKMDNTGIFSVGFASFESFAYTPFLTFGPGGIGETMLSVISAFVATLATNDSATIRQVVGLGGLGVAGWAGTQSPGGQLALDSGAGGTPKLKWRYGANHNFAIDSDTSSLGLSGQVMRGIHDADETTGAEIWAFDSAGNLAIAGHEVLMHGVQSDGATPDGHTYKITIVAGAVNATQVS